MNQIIGKAQVLIEALPYIQRFRNETVVIKFGGSIMDHAEGVRAILKDVALMECIGMRPVLVHGGGKAISRQLKEANLPSVFVRGLRKTDAPTMRIVESVLNHEINPQLVACLQEFGLKARGIHGDDVLTVTKHTETDPQTGATLDWDYVGDVSGVDVEPIEAYLAAHLIPVITPVGRGADKMIYNVNADEAAAAVARALKARRLVFLSDVPGLLENPQEPSTVISTLRVGDVDELVRRGVISGGMMPKIGGAVKAIQAGVQKVHIIDDRLPHSLLLELFTDHGVGTEIVA